MNEKWQNQTFWWMNLINQADLDLSYHWLFISWQYCASKPNHTIAKQENILEIIRNYPYYGTCFKYIYSLIGWVFFKLENKNTLLNSIN